MSNVLNKIEEVVHRAEDLIHHKDEVENDVDGVDDRYVIYLNKQVESEVTGGHVEDRPVYQIAGAVIDYLNLNDVRDRFEALLEDSKADTKAYLIRAFDFRKFYVKKVDGESEFYSRSLAYPPANLVNDIQYALSTEGE